MHARTAKISRKAAKPSWKSARRPSPAADRPRTSGPGESGGAHCARRPQRRHREIGFAAGLAVQPSRQEHRSARRDPHDRRGIDALRGRGQLRRHGARHEMNGAEVRCAEREGVQNLDEDQHRQRIRVREDRPADQAGQSAQHDQLFRFELAQHGYGEGEWTDSAVRRYVRDAGELLTHLHVLTRADCTTRNAKKAANLAATYDSLEARIAQLQAQEELDAIRPDLDGKEIMEILNIKPSPLVGQAYDYLLELRLEHGPLGAERATTELLNWWSLNGPKS